MKALTDFFPFAGLVQPVLPPRATPAHERAAPRSSARWLEGRTDEAVLCAAALRGESDAWNALVQRHNHRVVVALLARGVPIERAKDIAQEAWIKLIKQQRHGRLERLQLPGLAIAQAAFLALEGARRAASTHQHEPLDEPRIGKALTDPRGDAESRLITEERVSCAVDVLSRSSSSARKVFRLVYGGDGLSHAEVAERVGLSLQRVRQILCELRAELRVALERADKT